MLDTHYVVVALVEIDDQVFPRLYYHSNSQGTWRAMPYASKISANPFADFCEESEPSDADKRIVHYGKGQCETDTQLPIPLICALNSLPYSSAQQSDYRAAEIVKTRGFEKNPNFHQQVQFNESMFLQKGAPKQFFNTGMVVPNPPNPKHIHMPVDKNLHPDFSNVLQEFKQTIPHYGEVTVKIFASKDESLLYMFYEASDGRAFLASVECVQGVGINSYGVRESIIHIENMDAPLLEYRQQIPPGFGPKKYASTYESTTYQSNWNFLRELELIQMYYSKQGRALPDRV